MAAACARAQPPPPDTGILLRYFGESVPEALLIDEVRAELPTRSSLEPPSPHCPSTLGNQVAGLGGGGVDSPVGEDSPLARSGMDWEAALRDTAAAAAAEKAQAQLASDWERWALSVCANAEGGSSSSESADAANSCMQRRRRGVPPWLTQGLRMTSPAAGARDARAQRAWLSQVWSFFNPSHLLCGSGAWDAPPQRIPATEKAAEDADGATPRYFWVDVSSAPSSSPGKQFTVYTVTVRQASSWPLPPGPALSPALQSPPPFFPDPPRAWRTQHRFSEVVDFAHSLGKEYPGLVRRLPALPSRALRATPTRLPRLARAAAC